MVVVKSQTCHLHVANITSCFASTSLIRKSQLNINQNLIHGSQFHWYMFDVFLDFYSRPVQRFKFLDDVVWKIKTIVSSTNHSFLTHKGCWKLHLYNTTGLLPID